VAQTHPIRRLGTRAALLSIGLALGVTLAPRVVGAADQPVPPVDETQSTVPATVGPAATTTSTSSTSTSTSTTTTTAVTTPPPTSPPELLPPLVVDYRQPAEVANALAVNRAVAAARRTQQTRPAAVAELPFTGGGNVSIALSGLTALGIGGFALWWGSRKRPVLELEPVESAPTE
jgi:hypothetical protein